MKSNDFLVEGIVEDAHEMHQDHEVQMAREECYHAAGDAISLHRLLKHVSEQQGIEGWVAAKITLAADYLNTVREYLEYELMSGHQEQMSGTEQMLPVAEGVITADDFKTITEVNPHDFDSDEDYYAAKATAGRPKHRTASTPRRHPDDPDFMDPDQRRLRAEQERLKKAAAEKQKGVAEGKLDEKSVSQAQFRTMAAVAHNPKFAKKVGISQKVGREFHQADKGANYKKLPKKVNELDMYGKAPAKDADDWSQATVKYADPATAANKPTAADWAKNSADFDKKYPTPQAYNQRQIELYNKKYPGVPAPTDLTGDSEENRQAQLKALQTPGVKEAKIDFAKKMQKNIGKSNTARAKTQQGVEHWTKDLSKDQLDKLAGPRYKKDVTVKEMSSGSVATDVNPTPKNKAKTGTLFGGTYKQPKAKK
jgi:hypothetical protein